VAKRPVMPANARALEARAVAIVIAEYVIAGQRYFEICVDNNISHLSLYMRKLPKPSLSRMVSSHPLQKVRKATRMIHFTFHINLALATHDFPIRSKTWLIPCNEKY
jgi:hypothetical protein